jgi:hypothetical protein
MRERYIEIRGVKERRKEKGERRLRTKLRNCNRPPLGATVVATAILLNADDEVFIFFFFSTSFSSHFFVFSATSLRVNMRYDCLPREIKLSMT